MFNARGKLSTSVWDMFTQVWSQVQFQKISILLFHCNFSVLKLWGGAKCVLILTKSLSIKYYIDN